MHFLLLFFGINTATDNDAAYFTQAIQDRYTVAGSDLISRRTK